MPLGHGWLKVALNYTRIRNRVVEPRIKKYGKPGQIAVNVASTGAEPYESQLDGETLHDGKFLQTKFEKADNQGTLVEKDDVLYLLSTEGVTIDPDLANRVIVGGVTYQIVRIDPLEPGIVTMFWYVHARK